MFFYIALVPALINLRTFTTGDFIVFEMVLVAVFISVLTGYVALANRARRFVRSSRAVRSANRATGTVMAGAAILVATR